MDRSDFIKKNLSLRNGNLVEKNSSLFNFVPFNDETEITRLGRRLEFGKVPKKKNIQSICLDIPD